MKIYLSILIFFLSTYYSISQNSVKFIFKDSLSDKFLSGVSVSINGKNTAVAGHSGICTISLQNGKYQFLFSCIGYESKFLSTDIQHDTSLEIFMNSMQKNLNDVEVISTTRINQPIENAPIKVEVLGKEDMNEESTIRPANIASILGDVSGVQVLQSSATSGNVNIHIQGLDGRYTQILKDGIPLYDGFSGNFGILSIPPLDLQQIELIKGSASTLYGGGAIGGLINLISRKPTTTLDAAFVINQTTLNETNANAYLAKRNNHFGYTFFAGYTYQKQQDVNKDGFSDLPRLHSFNIHPQLFFYFNKTTITAGYNGTFEKRNGGDMLILNNDAQGLHQYFEDNHTRRNTGESLVEQTLSNKAKLYFKNSASWFGDNYTSNTLNYYGKQLDYYSELSTLINYGQHNSFVGGVNIVGNKVRLTNGNEFIPNDSLHNNTIGFFAQNTWEIKNNTTLELGLRDDIHNKYGNFFLPRLAFFNRFDEHWAMRLGVGCGYKTPDPYAPYYIDYSPNNIALMPANIQAEKSIGYNAEVNYKKSFGNGNSIFINQAFFLTQINHPIFGTDSSDGNLYYTNANKSVTSKGFDTYIKATIDNWELYAGCTFTIVKRNYLTQNQFMPYAPKNRMAFTIVKDFDKVNIHSGLEGSYTGSQKRLDGTNTPNWMFMAAMISKKFGKHLTLVLNCENLLNYKQSNAEKLYTGSISNPQFVPLWAPIDERVINLSIKFTL